MILDLSKYIECFSRVGGCAYLPDISDCTTVDANLINVIEQKEQGYLICLLGDVYKQYQAELADSIANSTTLDSKWDKLFYGDDAFLIDGFTVKFRGLACILTAFYYWYYKADTYTHTAHLGEVEKSVYSPRIKMVNAWNCGMDGLGYNELSCSCSCGCNGSTDNCTKKDTLYNYLKEVFDYKMTLGLKSPFQREIF